MRKLYRSRNDNIISGVCGGIGEFFNIDPIVIRIIALVFLTSNFTSAVFVYFIAVIIIPMDDGIIYQDDEDIIDEEQDVTASNSSSLVAIGLILLGIFLLLRNFVPGFNFSIMNTIRRFFNSISDLWPILLIVLGVYILFNKKEEE